MGLRGDGGEDEQTEVATVMASSNVCDVLVEALENRALSFNGSNLNKSGDRPAWVELTEDDAVQLILRFFGTLSSLSTGVVACDSAGVVVVEDITDSRFCSGGEPGTFIAVATGDVLSLLSSKRCGSR
jgi:hypothetical protein